MKSGMLAAEALFDELTTGDANKTIDIPNYEKGS
jgi:hypothetical protein